MTRAVSSSEMMRESPCPETSITGCLMAIVLSISAANLHNTHIVWSEQCEHVPHQDAMNGRSVFGFRSAPPRQMSRNHVWVADLAQQNPVVTKLRGSSTAIGSGTPKAGASINEANEQAHSPSRQSELCPDLLRAERLLGRIAHHIQLHHVDLVVARGQASLLPPHTRASVQTRSVRCQRCQQRA